MLALRVGNEAVCWTAINHVTDYMTALIIVLGAVLTFFTPKPTAVKSKDAGWIADAM
jgi:hypothetical protein